jgi:hypothetical protein
VNLRQMKRTDMIHMNPTLKLEVDWMKETTVIPPWKTL